MRSTTERKEARSRKLGHVETWVGAYRPYDLVKEFIVALLAVTLLTLVLSLLFSSPDAKPLTIARWAQADPHDFLSTAVSELDGSSGIAGYGPPYNHAPDAAQSIFGLSLQNLGGVRIPVDTAQEFVIGPLQVRAASDPQLARAVGAYRAASVSQQQAWSSTYAKALDKATSSGGAPQLAQGDYGPVQTMMAALLTEARSGGLDGQLLSTKQFYQTDYTRPLLFMSDGAYFEDLARGQHLAGDQWGMMNETGSWPGQAWLWLYTFWYQVPPWSSSGNADALVWAIMMVLTVALICVPFVPGLRSLPKRLGVYRLIWRDYYRQAEGNRR